MFWQELFVAGCLAVMFMILTYFYTNNTRAWIVKAEQEMKRVYGSDDDDFM